MAHVLLLVHRMPYPPNKGDKLRSYHLLRHLQRRHRVFLGCFADSAEDEAHVAELRALCPDLFVTRLDRRRAAARSLRSWLRREPLTLGYFEQPEMRAWVQATARSQRLDATVVFCSSMADYAPAGIPTLVDLVDLDSAKWAQFARTQHGPRAWAYRYEARALLAHERRLALRSEAVFFATALELSAFEAAAPDCRGRAEVMGNGVDVAHYAPSHQLANPFRADELPLVFTGSMGYWPNVDAVCWFVQAMLPGLRRQFPQLRLHVVGREPARAVRALASEAVVVTGAVDDVRPYLQHAAAVVAPVRLARGIQNKVLEAMAMAQPVVTTEACARAVGAGAAEGLLAAADAEGLVQRLVDLLRRPPDEVRRLGLAAREFVSQRCRWDRCFEPLDRNLARLGLEG